MERIKIAYRFADGHVEEVEVEPEVAEALKELDRQEYNNTQKETRRHVTFDSSDEGEWLAVNDLNFAALINGPTEEERLHMALSMLKPRQRELIEAVYYRHITISEYAAQEGVSQPAITQRLQTAIKNLKEFLSKTL